MAQKRFLIDVDARGSDVLATNFRVEKGIYRDHCDLVPSGQTFAADFAECEVQIADCSGFPSGTVTIGPGLNLVEGRALEVILIPHATVTFPVAYPVAWNELNDPIANLEPTRAMAFFLESRGATDADVYIFFSRAYPEAHTHQSHEIITPVVSKTANYTTTATDGLILCDASGGAFTITLVNAGLFSGRKQEIKKVDSSVNAVTVAGGGGQTIDGDSDFDLLVKDEVAGVRSDSSNWQIV